MPTKEQGKEFDSTSAFPRMASLGKKHELVSILPTAHKKEAATLSCSQGGVTAHLGTVVMGSAPFLLPQNMGLVPPLSPPL